MPVQILNNFNKSIFKVFVPSCNYLIYYKRIAKHFKNDRKIVADK